MHLRGLSTGKRIRVAAVACGTLVAGLLSAPAADARPAPEPPLTTMSVKSPPGDANVRVLIFHGSAAAGDESPVVNAGIEAVERIGLSGPAGERFEVEATDDASVFTDGTRLGRYNAVVFLTGAVTSSTRSRKRAWKPIWRPAAGSSACTTPHARNRTRTGSPD